MPPAVRARRPPLTHRGRAAAAARERSHESLVHGLQTARAINGVFQRNLEQLSLTGAARDGLIMCLLRPDQHGPGGAIAAHAETKLVQRRIVVEVVPDCLGFAMLRSPVLIAEDAEKQ